MVQQTQIKKTDTHVIRIKITTHSALRNFCESTGTIMTVFASRAIEAELKRRAKGAA